MHMQREGPSSADVATEAGTLLAGLGILILQVVPLALPGLLLFFIAPLALLAIAGVLLATPFVVPVWIARKIARRRSPRRRAPVPAREMPTIAAGQSAASR